LIDQTVAQVKEEIYSRMEAIIADPGVKYIPGASKRIDALLEELHQIVSKRLFGKPMPEEFVPRYSEILTELSNVHGFSQSELSKITGMERKALVKYIRPPTGEKKYFDEKRLEKSEDKESLMAELDRIVRRRIANKIRSEDKERLSEVLTKLHIAHGISINELSARSDMDRNVLAGYIHIYTGSPVKREMPFTPGPDSAKKTWWKKSGKSYKDMWEFAQDITEISPVNTKSDIRKIAVEAVNYVNADIDVKDYLLKYIKVHAFDTMQSIDGYSKMVQFALFFVQWLSEKRGYEITRKELNPYDMTTNPKGITFTTGKEFVSDYVPEKSGIQSKSSMSSKYSTLIKFFKYLEMERFTVGYSMLGLKTEMRSEAWTVAYNLPELDEMFNKIIMGQDRIYSLFMRLLLQVGSRPEQIFPIRCEHLQEFKTPVTDALGRNFYYISTQKIHYEAKKARGEEIIKKFPAGGTAVRGAGTSLISEKLRNDLIDWCKSRNNQPSDYIFQKFISLDGISEGIRRRKHILSGYRQVGNKWEKDPSRQKELSHDMDFYSLYGLRHTWTSVLYFIPATEQDALDYIRPTGGWAPDSRVPVGTYKQYMDRESALAIAEKYEIYIPPRWAKYVEDIKKGKEEKAAAPGAAMGAVELKKLEDTQKLLIDQLNAMAKKIEELEGKKK
jgi:integrase